MLFKKKCKHINNRTVTNLTKEYSRKHKSIRICSDCKNVFFSKEDDPNCNVMNFYIKEKE